MVESEAPSKPLGLTQCSFSLMQAEHGQVFVVAASHFIFLLLQPSHALITTDCQLWRMLYKPWWPIPFNRLWRLCSSTKT